MTWLARTESGRRRHILIDELTQDWRIGADGHLAWDGTSVSAVYHAIATKIGTIPTSPSYGSRLHDPWKMLGTLPRELSASLEASLEPLVASGVVKQGSIKIEVTPAGGAVASVSIEWADGGGQRQTTTVSIQPGILT